MDKNLRRSSSTGQGTSLREIHYVMVKLLIPFARNIVPSEFHNTDFSLVKYDTHNLPCFIFFAAFGSNQNNFIYFLMYLFISFSPHYNVGFMEDCFI